jgi:hypothetical protein
MNLSYLERARDQAGTHTGSLTGWSRVMLLLRHALSSLVSDVPPKLAYCEYDCREPDCCEWEQCEKRLKSSKQREKNKPTQW